MPSPTNDAPETTNPGSDDGLLSARLANLSPAQKELLRQRLAQRRKSSSATSSAPEPIAENSGASAAAIAIVGMGCRFPGANSVEEFWDLIESGREVVGPIPDDRWEQELFFDPTGRSPGKMSVNAIGAIDNPDQFDPAFFGIAPREASRMDPQQRLLLEVTWETFENAGIPIDSMAGSNTGVFIGIGGTDYSKIPARYPNYFEHIDAHMGTGNALSIASGRISYQFDFRGPSYIVDTACSSALVAIHNAVISLRRRECDAAVAGGVNLILSPETTIAFSKARMLSSDGHCRPFDDGANGYVRGEGCGILLLKRLGDAKADGDPIIGVIRGSAVNQDGRTSGITAPSGRAQVRVIDAALAQARLSVDDISYVEAHGTGTPLGDPIELMALDEVFSKRSSDLPPVRIGSVKANIGHTETASGIAGLLKVLQMFRRQKIPAQTNFHRINSNARLPSGTLQIASAGEPWTLPSGGHRIAGVSSFGFGGTNAHLIVESADTFVREWKPAERKVAPALVLPISAMDEEALAELADRFADQLDSATAALAHDVCGSAAISRSELQHRAVAVADSPEKLCAALRDLASGDLDDNLVRGKRSVGRRPRTAMLFTGQGSQYVSMAMGLAETLPSFASALDDCANVLAPLLPVSLHDVLGGTSESKLSIDHTSLAQSAIRAVQCALVDTLRDVGITPDVVAGHSIGELAALYAAGAISRDDALRISAYRGAAMGRMPEGGAMATVFTSAKVAQGWIDQKPSSVVIAAMNGPTSTVIAGEQSEVDAILDIAQAKEIAFRRLVVSHAFHSPMMQPAAEILREKLESFFCPAHIPSDVTFLSSMTGKKHNQPVDVDYWIRHLMQPVRFAEVIERLADEKVDLAIEVGPMPQLCGLLRHAGADGDGPTVKTVPTLNPKQDDYRGWVRAVATAWCAGVKVDWKAINRMFPSRRINLPTYPFQRQRCWHDPPKIGNHGLGGRLVHPMLGSRQSLASGTTLYSAVIRDSDPGFLADHIVSGSITVPAAAWMEALRAAASDVLPGDFELRDIEISRALFLEPGQPVSLQTTVGPAGFRCKIQIDSRADEPDASWQRCASAVAIAVRDDPSDTARSNEPMANAQCVDRDEFYESLAAAQLEYGDYFQVLDNIVCEGSSARASLRLADELKVESDLYRLHPALLDGALQLIATVVPLENEVDRTYLPVGAERLCVYDGGPITTAEVRLREPNNAKSLDEITADVELFSVSNDIVARLDGVRLKSLRRDQARHNLDPHRWLYTISWIPIDIEPLPDEDKSRYQVWSMGSGDALDETKSLLETIQAAIALEPPPTLRVITRCGFAVSGSEEINPVAAAVAGLCRVATNEHPQLSIRLLDVESKDDSTELIQRWSCSDVGETELALRNGQWFAPRLVPQPQLFASGDPDAEVGLPAGGAYRIRLDGTNRIEGLWSQRIAPPAVERSEVTVEVSAVGLNFSDVLKAMGLYPGVQDKVVPLGIEVCGRVTKLGDGVDRFQVGDRVMGVVRYGFASDDGTYDYLLTKVPAGISDDEAASLPIAFLTAHYALCHVGRLRKGESVLIHAGAGGVGLAAIEVAQAIGATIYATAGSPMKRQLLAELGVDSQNIFDSRDIHSIEAIRKQTDNRGVDVVLNSLPGDWIDQSLGLLAAYGRFLEIGKTDIYQNRAVGLLPFQDNLTYSAIDLDRLLRHRRDDVIRLFAEVVDRFREGVYRPLPITSFRLDELPAAMRFMAARRNVGKIVVTPPSQSSDVAAQPGIHLITGGSGAIAGSVARRLIGRGAKTVALVARRHASAAVRQIQQWASDRGAQCFYLQADCSDENSLRSAIDSLPSEAGKIVSVIHAAGVLDDALIHEMTVESFARVMQPKVDGAIALDRATHGHPVKSFQLLGSVAAVFGSPGQSNYAAANAFLEGFAADRRRRGLPASVIHWGPWASAGMADDPTRLRNLASRGLTPLDVNHATDLLIDGLDDSAPVSAVVVDADFGRMLSGTTAETLPSVLRSMKSELGESATASASLVDTALLSELAELNEADRVKRLCKFFADQLGKIIAMASDSIDPSQPLGSLGLDSLMAIELKNNIEAKLDITLPISKFMNEPSLQSLAEAASEIERSRDVH